MQIWSRNTHINNKIPPCFAGGAQGQTIFSLTSIQNSDCLYGIHGISGNLFKIRKPLCHSFRPTQQPPRQHCYSGAAVKTYLECSGVFTCIIP